MDFFDVQEAAAELREHSQQLNAFLTTWTSKQDLLLQKVDVPLSSNAPRGSSQSAEMFCIQGGDEKHEQSPREEINERATNLLIIKEDVPLSSNAPEGSSQSAEMFCIQGGEEKNEQSPWEENSERAKNFARIMKGSTPPHSGTTSQFATGSASSTPAASRSRIGTPTASTGTGSLLKASQLSGITDMFANSTLCYHTSLRSPTVGLTPTIGLETLGLGRGTVTPVITPKQPKNLFRRAFSWVSNVVIIFNSIVIAAAADYAMANPDAPESSAVLGSCELACVVYYILEILLKLQLERTEFWRGLDWKWNIFDCCLACQAAIEQVERLVDKDAGKMSNLSFFRICRLLKSLKLLRVVRLMRGFRELRLITSSLFGCIKSFIWACILSVTCCFMFGVAIMQLCSTYVSDKHTEEDNIEVQAVLKYWSSVTVSMLSLISGSTGGEDWAAMAGPLKTVSEPAYTMFIFFIAVFNFVILNIVNSIFIENMLSEASHDRQFIIDTMLEQKEKYLGQLKAVYDFIDENGDGDLTYSEFCKNCESRELMEFLRSMDIEIHDAKHFFRVLSAGGRRAVDEETFIEGCIKMKGGARSLDLMDLLYQHKASVTEQRLHLKHVDQSVHKMMKICLDLSQQLSEQKPLPTEHEHHSCLRLAL